MKIPIKKGRMVKVGDKMGLEGPAGNVFALEPVILVIWNLCDGKNSTEDIAKQVCEKTDAKMKDIVPIIEYMVTELEKVELVGYRK